MFPIRKDARASAHGISSPMAKTNGEQAVHNASEIPAMYTGAGLIIVCSPNPILAAYQSYVPEFPMTHFITYPGEAFMDYATASGTFSYQP